MKSSLLFAFAVIAGSTGMLQAQETATLITLDRHHAAATLPSFNDDHVTFLIDGDERTVPVDQIVHWGSPAENRLTPTLVLYSGEMLAGDLISLTEAEVKVASAAFVELTIPKRLAAGMLFRAPVDRLDHDRLLQQIQQSKQMKDLVTLANGDEIEGAARASEAPGGEVATTVQIGESNTETNLNNVVAINFAFSNNAPSERARMWLGLQDGSRLAIRTIQADGENVRLELVSGITLRINRQELFRSVTWLQPVPSQFVYLSQLPVAGYRHIPFIEKTWPLGVDQNVLGGRLMSGGQQYTRGLGMHSASRATVELDRKYQQFQAELAVDDFAGRRGAVIFRVFLDTSAGSASNPWQMAFESPVVRGGEPPIPVRVDVSAANRMAVVVDFSERGDECDYANWLNARLVFATRNE